jgi:hypothetical protein
VAEEGGLGGGGEEGGAVGGGAGGARGVRLVDTCEEALVLAGVAVEWLILPIRVMAWVVVGTAVEAMRCTAHLPWHNTREIPCFFYLLSVDATRKPA